MKAGTHRYLGTLVASAILAVGLLAPVSSGAARPSHVQPTGAEAESEPSNEEEPLQETLDPLAADAAWLSESMDLPVEEVLSRLQLQEVAGGLEASLAQQEPDSFAGLWLDQGDEFRVVVSQVQGTDEGVFEPYVEEAGLTQLVDMVFAEIPLSGLESQATDIIAEWLDAYETTEGAFDLWIDVKQNRIEVKASTDENASAVESLPSAASGPSEVAVTVGELATPDINIYGGLALTTCTTGFSTRTTTGGQRGVATAAHCGNTQSYSGNNLPHQTGDMQGNQDVQWHSLPSGVTAQPWARDSAGFRTITATLGRSGQPIGALVCGYGKTSGYRCGRVTFKNFAPNWINSPAPTFIVLHENGVTLSQGGDSGGPWYAGGTAYGINSGHTDGTDAVYMAINYISSINVALLLG